MAIGVRKWQHDFAAIRRIRLFAEKHAKFAEKAVLFHFCLISDGLSHNRLTNFYAHKSEE